MTKTQSNKVKFFVWFCVVILRQGHKIPCLIMYNQNKQKAKVEQP